MENGKEPIHPIEREESLGGNWTRTTVSNGLTKREYFAAMAMQGLLASCDSELTEKAAAFVAKESVMAADTLLAQLNTP